MYKILLSAFILLNTFAYGSKPDYITYDWLVELGGQAGYTDHISHFKRLFDTVKVRGFLECGCGFSTKYFLDHCDKVISIEFLNPGCDDNWFKKCLDMYQDYTNWVPLTYNSDHADVSFNRACAYACSEKRDYSFIDPTYLLSLDRFFKMQLQTAADQGTPIDVAFVDPGVYVRGDMVKLFLENRVPIVMAHDTNCDAGEEATQGFYVWFVVRTPPDYEKIRIPSGAGTTFWISKELPDVIASIKDYRDLVISTLENSSIQAQ